MWWLLSFALAGPPEVPTWGSDDREPAVDEDPQGPTEVRLATERVGSSTPIPLEPASPGPHGWASPDALTVAITGEAGRRYFLVATHRAGGEVVHWRQGPYAVDGETGTVAVELPASAVAALPTEPGEGMGWLTVRVVTNRRGQLVSTQTLPRRKTYLGRAGPTSLPRASWSADRDFPTRAQRSR